MTKHLVFVLGISAALTACSAANSVNTNVSVNNNSANANAANKTISGGNSNATSAANPAASTAKNSTIAKDDVFGFFFIAGKPAPEFQDIKYINLGGEGEYGAGANPPYHGELAKEKKNESYKLMKPEISGNNIKFKTETLNGINYEFDGTLKRKDLAENQPAPDDVVMSGTLKKMENGKQIAESLTNFTWSVGD